MKRYNVYKVFSEDEQPKVITAKDAKQALTAYIHYDIGYVPDVLKVSKEGFSEQARTRVNKTVYKSIVR